MLKISKLIKKLSRPEYRQAYLRSNVDSSIAHQIQLNREARGWTQKDLAKKLNTGQSAVSRIESPGYGKISISKLLEVAEAFDVALEVKFVPWSKLTKEVERWSASAQRVKSFDDDVFTTYKEGKTVVSLQPTMPQKQYVKIGTDKLNSSSSNIPINYRAG